jgi:hypothetical protein
MVIMRLIWKQAALGVVVTMTLVACAGEVGQFQSRMDAMVGRATKDQFLKDWGPPISQVMGDQNELWLYRSVLLQFDREGILREWQSHQH